MKIFITGFLLLFSILTTIAQENSIQGKITDNNGTPLVGVNVLIKNSQKGTQTDLDGNFKIENLPKGNKELEFSFIGYKRKVLKISVPSNSISVVLYEGNELLQEVVLKGRNNKFSRKKTAYVSKLPLKDLENTQVYTTVTSDLLESQIVTNLDEAMTNATGIYKLWEGTGRAPGNGTAFFASRGFSVQPRLIDGIAGVTFSAIDPSYIERIEVIKGPSATLFGSTETSLGGLINVVTKKPFEGVGGNVSYAAGSFGLHRVSLDYNTPLGKSNAPYFRINASYLTQDSFQDAGFKNTFFVAPSISYRVSNRLNISANIEFSDTEQTNPSMLFLRRGLPVVSSNIEELNIDSNKSFTSNDITLKNLIFNTRAFADYKISENWTSRTFFSSSYAETDGIYQFQFDGGSVAILQLAQIDRRLEGLGLPDPTLAFIRSQINPLINPMLQEASDLLQQDSFTRVFSKRDANETRVNLQQNFTGDFKIGEVRNRMVFGVDYVHNRRISKNKNANPLLTSTFNFPQLIATFNGLGLSPFADFIENGFGRLSYFDAFFSADGSIIPTNFTPNAALLPNREQLDAVFAQLDPIDNKLRSKTIATYLSDVINITPSLTVNFGLRLDHFIQDGNDNTDRDNFTKTTFSPNAGILFQPIKNKLSLFANYQTGFVNANPALNGDGSITVFEPQKAVQFEGGIKTNLFKGKLNLGASYYHITVNDFTTADPNSSLFPVTIDIAEVVSKGFDFEMNANPFNGLNIRASYSLNNMKYTDTFSKKATNLVTGEEGRDIVEFENRRPESAGPENLYNFWADYKFQEGTFAENFGLGIGFNGASENLTVNNAATGVFTLPSYTIYNASIYYDVNKFRIGLKANNFTNKEYFTGWTTVNAQAPRAFLGSVTYKF